MKENTNKENKPRTLLKSKKGIILAVISAVVVVAAAVAAYFIIANNKAVAAYSFCLSINFSGISKSS